MFTKKENKAAGTAKKVAAISAATLGGIVSMPFVVAGTAIYDALGIVGGVLVDPIEHASEYKALTPVMPVVNTIVGTVCTVADVPVSIVAGPKAVGNEIYNLIMKEEKDKGDPGMPISEAVEFVANIHETNGTIVPKPGLVTSAAAIAAYTWCTQHQDHSDVC